MDVSVIMTKMSDEKVVEVSQNAYDEARSALDAWNREARTDLNFYLSDQWDDADKQKLINKGVPVLTLNYIKKTIDLITGFQRQNRSDIRYFPIEGGDALVAEVLSMISMWVMKTNDSRFYLSEAFKDGLNTGIGWIAPEVDYSKDPINGDIFIRHESPFNMLYDPYFKRVDLSDCNYIIRHKLLNKDIAIELWPDYEDRINAVAGARPDQTFRQDPNVPVDRGQMVLVMEYWYRSYSMKNFIVSENGEFEEIEDEDMEDLVLPDGAEIIKKKMPEMRVAIMVGKDHSGGGSPVVVVNDISPYATNEYPFIPIFCYLTNSASDWDKKLQGLIRPMRDSQREKNKRRSSIMQIVSTIASSGYDMEKGAYDDINAFRSGGAGKIFERNRGFSPAMRLPAPEMPASIIQLEQMFTNDIAVIGASPEMLGHVGEKGSAGITIQLRQKQGMVGMQEVFDNLSMAVQKFGRMLVELIVGNFDRDKIERILGEDMPYKMEIEALTKQLTQMEQQLKQMAQTMHQLGDRETDNPQEHEQMEAQEVQLQRQTMEMTAQFQQGQQELARLNAEQQEFWVRWDDLEVNSRYDCSVSETIENETHRISVLSTMQQAQQYGMPVPMELMLDYSGLPEKAKEKAVQQMRAQQEAQAQQVRSEAALEQQKLNGQKEIELIKQGINPAVADVATPVQ